MVLSTCRSALARPLRHVPVRAVTAAALASAPASALAQRSISTSSIRRAARNRADAGGQAESLGVDDAQPSHFHHAPPRSPSSSTSGPYTHRDESFPASAAALASLRAPRNPLGVQLLSPTISSQVFPPTSPPTPPLHPHAVSLSQAHLSSHGLSPSQASELTETAFTLPPLQGKDLGEHFWNIGREASQPWLDLSERLAEMKLPPHPEDMTNSSDSADARLPDFDEHGRPSPAHWLTFEPAIRAEVEPIRAPWLRKSGWVRYPILTASDEPSTTILAEGEPVAYPDPDDAALVFDVETMVQAGPWPVMAAAASDKAWYSWLSPWLLGESDRKDHLIPFGSHRDNAPERLLIGHNVSYDRARILDEYSMDQSRIRFLDTQSLHVAVRGISSPQRPAWIQYRKNRAQKQARKMLEDQQLREEQRDELRRLLGGDEIDEVELEHLADIGLDLDALTDNIQGGGAANVGGGDGGADPDDDFGSTTQSAALQWQDISSTNSLAAVAALYCDIDLPKDLRNEFVEATDRQQILNRLPDLMNYCARDVAVTHQVYSQVLPSFRQTCPHPATFAGVLGIGSPILPIDDEWVQYQLRCHEKYEAALVGVQEALVKLAETLRAEYAASLANDDDTRRFPTDDPWLSQLDWSLKKERQAKLPLDDDAPTVPKWYKAYAQSKKLPTPAQGISVHILQLTLDGRSIHKSDGTWRVGDGAGDETVLTASPTSRTMLASKRGKAIRSQLGQVGDDVLEAIREKADKELIAEKLRLAATTFMERAKSDPALQAQTAELDWTPVAPADPHAADADADTSEMWPRWYWDLFKPSTGKIDLTIRTKIAPLLLKVSWQGCPLYHSREYGWVYLHRPMRDPALTTRQKPLVFKLEADEHLRRLAEDSDAALGDLADPHLFYKIPHSSGDDANVGSPFSKSFMSYFDDGILRSEHPDEIGKKVAKDALDLNAQCSYWVGVRDRVANQMVVWDGESGAEMGFTSGASGMGSGPVEEARRKGLILPQIVAMGTITRRAIEKTWLTASNAKKNRVGSELKAMVKAPPGWVIVGADVDSEELWICSVMGDAQFGLHGATAIGWMTLEGTKAAGTDLHSKTASILGTSRNQAKIFNYSRIYGAGIRHATQLMVKANPAMPREEAQQRAKDLYAKTKGQNTHSNDCFDRRFWYGGTESFVFNKLEEVATSELPRTPALDCGITAALSKKFLPKAQYSNGRSGEDFMPSRINWVVQSSGVDYLHLLITSMSHLCKHYDIAARFMISVHDEVRYLAREEDAHRAALALQIANLWTRAMFAFKLQMEDLPEGVAWFAAVDVDKVLRKEVDDPCITPSHPDPVASGKAYDIAQTLEATNGGSLHADGRPMDGRRVVKLDANDYPPYQPSDQSHRSVGERGSLFLQAQTSSDIHEIRALQRRAKNVEAHGSDVERPNGVEWAEMNGNSGQQSGKRNVSQRSKATSASRAGKASSGGGGTSSRVTRPKVAKDQSSTATPTQRAFHTSAICRSRARHEADLPASLKSLVVAFPVKPNRFRETIFWITTRHKQHVKWGLYRASLRACPRDEPAFQRNIKNRFHRAKHANKGSKIHELVQRAEERLKLLQAVQSGDAEAKAEFARQVAMLEERREAYHRQVEQHEADVAREAALNPPPRSPPAPKPRLQGSILVPTLFNYGLPRLKPQPPGLSIMIRKRVISRRERLQRQLDVAEMESLLDGEVEFMRQVEQVQDKRKRGARASTEAWRDAGSWKEPLQLQKSLMNESFRREHERAQSQVSLKVLKKTKAVRRSKIEWRTRRKAAERAASEGGEARGAGGKEE